MQAPYLWNSPQAHIAIVVVALSAVACIPSQRTSKLGAGSIALIVFLLGLQFPVWSGGLAGKIAESTVLLVIAIMSFCFRKNKSLGLGTVVVFGLALISLLVSPTLAAPWSVILEVVTAAALLPLFPLQSGYIGALNNLPGTLPAFLAVLLPVMGLHSLMQISDVPQYLANAVFGLAVIGSLITAIRAFVQASISRVIGAVGTLLLSPAWWLFASAGKVDPHLAAYVVAVGLSISGLRLCAYYVEARYGTEALESVPGLATTMPKFGVSFTLLIMAGLGIPVFAVFSNLSLVLISTMQTSLVDLFYICTVWFLSFAIELSLMHRLLFNQPRPNLMYTDLTRPELISVAVLLLLLIVGGLFPQVIVGFSS